MSSTNRGSKRRVDDFYETPGWATRAILPHLEQLGALDGMILEPSAGRGAIVKELIEAGVSHDKIVSYELDLERARESQSRCANFLEKQIVWKYGLVITNPPYTHAIEFAQKGYDLIADGGVLALLLRINWLASQRRAEWLRKHTPSLYVLPKRPSFTGKGTDSSDYAWMVWTKREDGTMRAPRVHILEV